MHTFLSIKRFALALGLVSAVMHLSHAQTHWPQWRGPVSNGIALEGHPPTTWSEEENIRWKKPIPGKGHASPVLWGKRLFLLTAVAEPAADNSGDSGVGNPPESQAERPGRRPGQGRGGRGGRGGFGGGQPASVKHSFQTLCLDKETGDTLWVREGMAVIPHEGHHPTNSYSSGSAVTDGQHVVSFFGSRGLFVYDMEGNLAWKKDLGDMSTRNGFGEGASPVLHGQTLVVPWDTEQESYLVAFDKRDGSELWRQNRDERTGWSTPYIVQHDGTIEVIVNASNKVRSYNLADGSLLWECAGQTVNAIPSVVADDRHLYAVSGYRGNAAMAIQLGKRGDLSGSDAITWTLSRGTPYVPSPLLMNGRLWFTQGNDAVITCVEAQTGKVHYTQERLDGPSGFYASPVGVDGKVYLAGRNGTTVVLEDSDTLKVLAVNRLDDPIDASPALSGNAIYIRGHQHLYCIAE
ncbi:MAG: PQQ-binding-like beta-propeller repeat protein [Verrucomicrobiota bacterium]|nr:PQQ-binding-like beta-propeller repeat protein [Verrucomicrobiota bacterium]|tara:strand:- start:608 stop:1999 length:1392 start_codon:yes stop_codon:yes gene_type:complete